jgi:hypothetical protein
VKVLRASSAQLRRKSKLAANRTQDRMTIIIAILGALGLGGLGAVGLGSLGIGGGIAAWFVAKNIPWKLIVALIVAVFIGLTVFAGYKTFKDTQAELTRTKVELSTEKIFHQAEKKRADDYLAQHAWQLEQLTTLATANSQIVDEAAALREQIRNMTLEQDFANDPSAAVAILNARSSTLNRMLISASRGNPFADRSEAPVGVKAGTPKSNSALQRTLQGMWPNGVPQAK